MSSLTRTKGGGGYRHRKHQHRYIAPEFNYTAKYWALVSETTTSPPPTNTSKHHKCTLKDGQSEEMAKVGWALADRVLHKYLYNIILNSDFFFCVAQFTLYSISRQYYYVLCHTHNPTRNSQNNVHLLSPLK